jgi:hypothetical protein
MTDTEQQRTQLGLQRQRLACTMGAHNQCDGYVPGGQQAHIPCLCTCHQPSTSTQTNTQT